MVKVSEYSTVALEDLSESLGSSLLVGISDLEAKERLQKYGPNSFGEEKKKSIINKIVDELRSPLAFTLLIAGIATTLLGEYVDATVIFLSLVVNISINIFQEGRASKAFQALKAGVSLECSVVRGGRTIRVSQKDLVIGDILLLQTGETVPADARIIEAFGAQLNESVLTGEWAPVMKQPGSAEGVLPITEQRNMLFMGTLVAAGSIRALVVGTGEKTAFGKIALELRSAKTTVTPMQENISALSRLLTTIILIALVLVFLLGIYRGIPIVETFMIAVAIAVAAIPEGMPAAVSVMLAIGMQRILARGGLVRSLLAAETLGSATVIITDKTGTLTEGVMTLDRVVCFHALDSSNEPFRERRLHEEHGDERDALAFAFISSNVIIENNNDKFKQPEFRGSPVEVALARATHISGIDVKELNRDYKRIDAVPFASSLRLSLALTEVRGMKYNKLIGVGAAEELLAQASLYYADGQAHELDERKRQLFASALKNATQSGVRVVGVGFVDTSLQEIPRGSEALFGALYEKKNFVLCGLMYLSDPLRTEVKRSILTAVSAGIRVIMATGDNLDTARSVALAAGIVAHPQAEALLGSDVDLLSDTELTKKLITVGIFARMLPTHKQRIAELLKKDGEIVAMTGDGVNDAPALKTAAIGIALGSGTDVAKESSGLVLTNNSFAVIVAAIEEGRRAVDNIRKNVIYLLSTSFSEVMLIVASLAFALPLPLLPVQILWTNMLTEGFMNFAFAFELPENGIMTRDPRKHGAQHMLTKRVIAFMATVGFITGGILVVLYALLLRGHEGESTLRTIIFITLTLITTLLSFSLRDLHTPIWKTRPWSNLYLLGALSLSFLGVGVALYVPSLSRLLSLDASALSSHLSYIFISILIMFIGVETAKYFIFNKNK